MTETHQALIEIKPEQLKSWLPVDAIIHDGRPSITWMDFSDVVLSEPFFHETVARIAVTRKEELRTDVDLLLQFEKIADSIKPSGFVFHSSRCGSTLVANACRTLSGSVVISEAPVLDKLLSRFFTDAEPNSSKELLYMVLVKAAISALGQRRVGNEQHFFIKFACTTSLQMRRLRKIFPDVPFLFLYRVPIEVMVSNLRSTPEWMRPESNPATAAAIVGVDLSQLEDLTSEEFCARALGRFYAEGATNLGANTACMNYDQLNPDTLLNVVKYFGVNPSPEETNAIKQVSRLYSKDPSRSQAFVADSHLKRTSASELVLEMAARWAVPSYERLENSN